MSETEQFSQGSEDQIIADILSAIGKTDAWCVEFGAWDGKYASNSRNLIREKNYSAVLIEPDPVKFSELCETYSTATNVTRINLFVEASGENSLDNILRKTDIPADFDLCSIDIDGNDLHVWGGVKEYRPKVVVIEFNPSIPPEVDYVQELAPEINRGASIDALERVARSKGYFLAAQLPFNGFFVDEKYRDNFAGSKWTRENLVRDTACVTSIFCGYDGRLMLSGSKTLVWHGITINEHKLQQLPVFLQTYPPNYTKSQSLAFNLVQAIDIHKIAGQFIDSGGETQAPEGFEYYLYAEISSSDYKVVCDRLGLLKQTRLNRIISKLRGRQLKLVPSWWPESRGNQQYSGIWGGVSVFTSYKGDAMFLAANL